EAGVTDYWARYIGLDGKAVGIDTFGESAPGGDLYEHFGLTTPKVVEAVKSVLA
ncbi:MAG: transketolase-like TK C-terminal-containing protein, partial [Thiohalospira sp.]